MDEGGGLIHIWSHWDRIRFQTENQHTRLLYMGGLGSNLVPANFWLSGRYNTCLSTHHKEVKWINERTQNFLHGTKHLNIIEREITEQWLLKVKVWTLKSKGIIKRIQISPHICVIIVLKIIAWFASNVVLKKIMKALGWFIYQIACLETSKSELQL